VTVCGDIHGINEYYLNIIWILFENAIWLQ
jgi:hypothetical protein